MSNVTPLDNGTRNYWTCVCGCATHYVTEKGDVICASCDDVSDGLAGDWAKTAKEVPIDVPEEQPEKVLIDFLDPKHNLRHMLEKGLDEDIQFALIIKKDGVVRSWRKDFPYGKKQRKWLKKKLKVGYKNITS